MARTPWPMREGFQRGQRCPDMLWPAPFARMGSDAKPRLAGAIQTIGNRPGSTLSHRPQCQSR